MEFISFFLNLSVCFSCCGFKLFSHAVCIPFLLLRLNYSTHTRNSMTPIKLRCHPQMVTSYSRRCGPLDNIDDHRCFVLGN